MKFLLPLLFLPFAAFAQQDFDYALYTRHSQCSLFKSKDSIEIELLLERRIVKEGSHLKIVPLMNTGNTVEYGIQFQGCSFGNIPRNRYVFNGDQIVCFNYATEDMKYRISIWPTIPLVEIHEAGTGKLYTNYY